MSRIAVLALALAALAAHAAVTNVVDVAALAAAVDAGISETNGWTLSGLGKYAAGAGGVGNPVCVKFDTLGDSLASPDFEAPIIGMEVGVRCSATNNATRFLYVRDANGEDRGVVATCARGDKYETQLLSFGELSGFSRFRIVLGGAKTTGNWGMGALSVITADPIAAPTALAVARTNTTSCVLQWVNGANAVSNRIDTYLVDAGIGDKVIYRTDFDGFYGNATTTRDFTGSVPELLGDSFSGIRVYGAAGTSGVCQLGTGKDFGILRYAGLPSYERVNLTMTAKRYSGDNADTIVAYEEDGSTNAIKTLTLTDEFAEYTVDLSKDVAGNDVPDGAAILIGYYTTKSNRRVLIDSLSIVRSGSIEETLVDSRFIPAAPGAMRFSTRGVFDLVPNAEYRFEVSAQSGEGLLSSAISAEARLLAVVPGFGIILR